ncbi:hypothetical protein PVK06_004442 [Gossypium arboreum]|uniref:Uncharacterized protein n=1 Tax=Gossypium arboreum TaxID=29729 RepID=A0ABR0QS16_GOSAR|nr:hypothetical protein PVK06_004442 [Gossypium arboreum]
MLLGYVRLNESFGVLEIRGSDVWKSVTQFGVNTMSRVSILGIELLILFDRIIIFNMPRVNVNVNAQYDGTSSVHSMSLRKVNVPNEGVGPLMEAMIGAFQKIAGVNPAPAPVNRGLLLERLQALGGKEFSRVKGTDPTVAEY